MKFLGIDLGWTSGASGLCCLEWSDGSLHLLNLDRQQVTSDILNWVEQWVPLSEPAMIAVDAPTLSPQKEQRLISDYLTFGLFPQIYSSLGLILRHY
jgi:predicted RNase H-like nuclease